MKIGTIEPEGPIGRRNNEELLYLFFSILGSINKFFLHETCKTTDNMMKGEFQDPQYKGKLVLPFLTKVFHKEPTPTIESRLTNKYFCF